MRGKKVALTTLCSLIEEFAAIICGFVLPRLILSVYGSKYNGLTTSITQFLSCAVLLRSGIGGATRAALYKPLAEHDQNGINAIVRATDIFMKRVGIILAGTILIFAALYPFFVRNEFNWFFTFSLFLIIGASTFAESFFGITYLIVLQADQQLWVSSLLKTVCIVINTIISVILIISGATIHVVKLGSSLIYVAYPIILGAYVRKRYQINTHVEPNYIAIAQRWDAFWQQVAVFVMDNTDVVVLTVFTNMLEVSVYSVYNMVVSALKRAIVAFSNGIEAAFGNMIANNESETLRDNFAIIENIIFSISTVIFSCAAVLILNFVSIYTKNINDVNYIRPLFAYVIIIAQFFNGIRLPYQLIVQAAGHYKQTKFGAIIEPVLNISISVAFVLKYGLVGVAIGTLVATVFRTVQYSIYMSRNLVKRNFFVIVLRTLVSTIECCIIVSIVYWLRLPFATGYLAWAGKALITLFISIFVVGIGNCICFRKETRGAFYKVKSLVIHS